MRPVFIGATNSSTCVGKDYNGLLRGEFFGLSMNAVQVMAVQAAFTRFDRQIAAI